MNGLPLNDSIWLVFDIFGGNFKSAGYWFNTRQEAREHIKRNKRNSITLGYKMTKPKKYCRDY